MFSHRRNLHKPNEPTVNKNLTVEPAIAPQRIELEKISEQQIRDAIVMAQPDIQYDYDYVAIAQRDADQAILDKVVAELEARNKRDLAYLDGAFSCKEELEARIAELESNVAKVKEDTAREIQKKLYAHKMDNRICLKITDFDAIFDAMHEPCSTKSDKSSLREEAK